MIHFTCSCGKDYAVPEQFAGKRVRCKKCNNITHVLPCDLEDIPVMETGIIQDPTEETFPPEQQLVNPINSETSIMSKPMILFLVSGGIIFIGFLLYLTVFRDTWEKDHYEEISKNISYLKYEIAEEDYNSAEITFREICDTIGNRELKDEYLRKEIGIVFESFDTLKNKVNQRQAELARKEKQQQRIQYIFEELGVCISQENLSRIKIKTKRELSGIFKELQTLATNRNPRAMYYLGVFYERGFAVEEDKQKSAEWHKKAFEAGDAYAMLRKAYFSDFGKKPVEEKKLWKAMEQECPQAKRSYAFYYEKLLQDLILEGYFDPDPDLQKKAFHWYLEAAKEGDSIAMYETGLNYLSGEGVNKTKYEGAKWIKKSAESGYAKAMAVLGYFYSKGFDGIGQDKEKAERWYQRANSLGNADRYLTAMLFGTNRYGIEDSAEEMRWYQKAADAGNESAQSRLDNISNPFSLQNGTSEVEKTNNKEERITMFLVAAKSWMRGWDTGEGWKGYSTQKLVNQITHIRQNELELLDAKIQAAKLGIPQEVDYEYSILLPPRGIVDWRAKSYRHNSSYDKVEVEFIVNFSNMKNEPRVRKVSLVLVLIDGGFYVNGYH